MAVGLRDSANRVIRELAREDAGSPLDAVAAARDLSVATNTALQAAVDRARAAGHSWREIGEVLGTSRQAAFQRFGRPIDPRTGGPLIRNVLPDAEERAMRLVAHLAKGRWERVRREFGELMRERLDADRLARGWTRTVAMIGRYERMGEPFVYSAGEQTGVDIPLYFEAGERVGRVVLDRDGRVVGLFLRPHRADSGPP